MSTTKKGKFIVIEGGDGSGKGTCVASLKEALAGEDVVFTFESGGTPLGAKIRNIILENEMDSVTELLLFSADRNEHVRKVILPALEAGKHVISDRFSASTYAYQVYARNNESHEDLFSLLDHSITHVVTPDLYIMLNVPPDIARERLGVRSEEMDRLEKEKIEFHHRVQEGYLKYLKEVPHRIIDATGTKEEVFAEVHRLVKVELGV